MSEAVPHRSCGPCNACCVHPSIFFPEFKKLPGVVCANWRAGTGCKIYETRPGVCRSHFCGWQLLPELDESWRPDLSNVYINVMSTPPGDLASQLPKGDRCFVFQVLGELRADHLGELTVIISKLIENGIPTVLTTAAPPGRMRKGLPLNPLLLPSLEKGAATFAETFAQLLSLSVEMPVAKVIMA